MRGGTACAIFTLIRRSLAWSAKTESKVPCHCADLGSLWGENLDIFERTQDTLGNTHLGLGSISEQ